MNDLDCTTMVDQVSNPAHKYVLLVAMFVLEQVLDDQRPSAEDVLLMYGDMINDLLQ